MPGFDLAAVQRRVRASAKAFEGEDDAKAAVATILREGARGAEALFIKRAEHASDPWSGHIAFPGGKRDPSDPSLLATARRETREEVGLELPEASLIARLEDVVGRTNGYRVAQFVFALGDPEVKLVPSPEVAEVMWVSLESIARKEGASTFLFTQGSLRVELPSLRWGSNVLWGMTYRMTMNLMAIAAEA